MKEKKPKQDDSLGMMQDVMRLMFWGDPPKEPPKKKEDSDE
jgi:hypothetical protein